ncbi:retrotransposon protein, putative, ty1-copia subclass [Tanacetum coccineum]
MASLYYRHCLYCKNWMRCRRNYMDEVCSICCFGNGDSFAYDPNPNSFNDSPNFSDCPPQPKYQTYSCELCENDAHYDYYCPPQVSFIYNQDPRFNQNFDNNNFPQTSPSFPQQYICCENCGGPHETFQCQPMNQNYYEPNPCYNSNSSGFDQIQPPQETSTEMLQARENLMEAIQAFLKKYDQIPPKEKSMALLLAEERFLKIKQAVEEEQNQPENIQELLLKLINDLQILNGIQLKQEEQAAKVSSQYWKPPIFYDDDDEESSIPLRDIISELPLSVAITPDLPITDSLIMEDEHLNTIPETESDEENESSVKDLNLTPSESEDLSDNEMKRDTPEKLQQISVKCIFIGYPKETMGYYFYFPPENKIVVARYAEFLEKNLISQEVSGRAVELEEIQDEDTSPSEITSEIPMEVEGFEPPHEEEAPVHRPVRTHRAPKRLCLNVKVEEHSLGDFNEPANYKAAILDPKSDKWLDAMNLEMQSMKDNQVWRLVDLPLNGKTVRSKCIFKRKTDMDGIVHTYKVRL